MTFTTDQVIWTFSYLMLILYYAPVTFDQDFLTFDIETLTFDQLNIRFVHETLTF